MESLDAIGFDMDHTLAVYNTPNFNKLCFEMAVEQTRREVSGIPEVIREIAWDPDAPSGG